MRRGAMGPALALTLSLVLSACGGAATTPPLVGITPAPASPTGPGASSSQEIPGSPIAGVVTSIDSAGLDQVRGFTLQSMNGTSFTFVIGVLENGADFAPGHLTEHMASAAPILVFFKVVDGKFVVYRLEDAG